MGREHIRDPSSGCISRLSPTAIGAHQNVGWHPFTLREENFLALLLPGILLKRHQGLGNACAAVALDRPRKAEEMSDDR